MKAMTYEERKKDLKEFVFSTPGGYRKFFVLGNNLQEAESNFMRIDEFHRKGFDLTDLPVRYENTKGES